MVTDRNYNELQVGDEVILYGKFKGLSLGTITNITDLTFCDVEYNNRTIKNIPSSDLIKYEKPNKTAAEKVVELEFMTPVPPASAPPIEQCRRAFSQICYNLLMRTRLSSSEVNDIYAKVIPLIDKAYECGVHAGEEADDGKV